MRLGEQSGMVHWTLEGDVVKPVLDHQLTDVRSSNNPLILLRINKTKFAGNIGLIFTFIFSDLVVDNLLMIQPTFDQLDLLHVLDTLVPEAFDSLEFGVIGFNGATEVTHYNAFLSERVGLSPKRVLGQSLFSLVVPSMSNLMLRQRFEEAAQARAALDEIIDYALVLRMRPAKVKLRLLAGLEQGTRYVLVQSAV